MTDTSKPTKASPETDTSSSSALSSKTHNALKKEVMTGQRQPKQRQDTRFKKGQPGNPSGRPKKKSTQNHTLVLDTSIDKIILEFANKELTVKSGDKIVTMIGEHALVQSQYKSALNGNVHATKDLLTRTERAENNKKLRQAERADGWREYKAHYSAKLLQMRKLDEEVDENSQLPHPDDVHVSCDNVVSFSGPMDKDQLERPCCIIRNRIRTHPYPKIGSSNCLELGAAQVGHFIENIDAYHDFALLVFQVPSFQSRPDHAFPATDLCFASTALIVTAADLPSETTMGLNVGNVSVT